VPLQQSEDTLVEVRDPLHRDREFAPTNLADHLLGEARELAVQWLELVARHAVSWQATFHHG
jgi:hypothetical protein